MIYQQNNLNWNQKEIKLKKYQKIILFQRNK